MAASAGATAASLDFFLATAARLPRLAAATLGGHAQPRTASAAAELLAQAKDLLGEHPTRASEIALAVSRIRPLVADPMLVAPFAKAFAEAATERLPSSGAAWTRAQAREALTAYVALEGFADSAGAAVLPLAARTAEGVSHLEAPEVAAALARLAAARSLRSGASEGDSSTLEVASKDVAAALQVHLAHKAESLKELSSHDLCSAAVGLARSPLLLPAAASAVAVAARGRLDTLSTTSPSLWDFSRAMSELLGRLGHNPAQQEHREQIQTILSEAWPLLSILSHRTFAENTSDDVMSAEAALCLTGMARLGTALQPTSEIASFVEKLVGPNSTALLALATSGKADPSTLELVGPLLRLSPAKEAWEKYLQYLALDGLPAFPNDEASTDRVITMLEWLAATENSVQEGLRKASSFPAFFDFALEELTSRFEDLQVGHFRRVSKLLSEVHLERPEHIDSMTLALLSGAQRNSASGSNEPLRVAPLALDLASFATLYVRLASMAASSSSSVKEDSSEKGSASGLLALTETMKEAGKSIEELTAQGDASSSASWLALSAFAQAVLRTSPSTAPKCRRQLVEAGLSLLDALCNSSEKAEDDLNPEQAHIFVTALRGFCAEPGAPTPPASCHTLLRALLQQASTAQAGDREARLNLAVLSELAADPNCPPSLRSVLPEPTQAQREAPSSARQRMQAAMSSGGSQGGSNFQKPKEEGNSGGGGFLKRFFGF
eukprot:TRINITY_DN9691_c0_g1_i1.p1 TRINITY_DN9691_c0_g1~~TRINITY_DN9691_c0_g1_i1.p1  ORF type:complete len:741 (-),score=169.11 TRINITY_DN9691_c0_g1_i1:328-2502(-)